MTTGIRPVLLILIGSISAASGSIFPYNFNPATGTTVGTAVTNFTPFDLSAAGHGDMAAILTLQNSGTPADGLEQGCVAPDGSGAPVPSLCSGLVTSTADVQTGASLTGTPTLGSLGINAGSNLFLIVNAAEPGGSQNGISIHSLQLTLYNLTGVALGTFALEPALSPLNLFADFTGVASAGYVFGLDNAQAGALSNPAAGTANDIILNNGINNIRLGVGAIFTNAALGPETIYAGNLGIKTPGPDSGGQVPEPASILLVATALIGLAAFTRRFSSTRSRSPEGA